MLVWKTFNNEDCTVSTIKQPVQKKDPNSSSESSVQSPPEVFQNPSYLFLTIILIIFCSEFIIMLVLQLLPSLPLFQQAIVDSMMLTILLFPLLFFLVYKPFRWYIDRQKKAENELIMSEMRFRDISENAREWIWEVDSGGKYTFASPVIEKILGHTCEEVIGRHFYDFFHPDDRDQLKMEALEAFSNKQSFRNFINRNIHKNGSTVWLSTSGIPIIDNGELLGYRGADMDITDRKILEERLREAAITDELTSLLNRRGFYTLAKQQCKIADRNKRKISLLYADLDNLKIINDELGHNEGDQAIVDIANILLKTFRESDIIGRIGGDEFAVLLTEISEPNNEKIIIDHIMDNLRFHNDKIADRKYKLSVSIGIAQYDPAYRCNIDELIALADKHMYEQKSLKKNS